MIDRTSPEWNPSSDWRIAVYILADPNSEIYCESTQKAFYRALEKERGFQSEPVFYVDEVPEADDSESEFRPEFERLVDDCRQGLFDLIVMDSVTCCLSHICADNFKLVKELNHLPRRVDLNFERERLTTWSPDSAEFLELFCFTYYFAKEQSKNRERIEQRIRRILRGENAHETYAEEDG